MEKELKSFAFDLKMIDEQGLFEGYAATFGNVDLGADIVDKGAFKKTIRESKGKVPILDHHNPTRQIGWNLEAAEDDHGLFVTGQLNLDVQRARERHSLMKQAFEVKGRQGLSIGYSVVKSEPDKEDIHVRRLKELKLMEYSIVTFPMNPAAMVTGVKYQTDRYREYLQSEVGFEGEKLERAVKQFKSLLDPEPGVSHSEEDGADIKEVLEGLNAFNASLKNHINGV